MFRRAQAFTLLTLLVACALLEAPAYAQATPDASPPVYKVVVPIYPTMIRTGSSEAVDQDGLVIVEARLNEAGAVSSAKPVAGHPLLRLAAVQAARQWEFAPAQEGEGERTVSLYFKFNTLYLSEPDSRLHPRVRLSPKYWVEVSRYSVKELQVLQSRNRRSKRRFK